MRRNWLGGLVFALALAVQALTPVATNLAMARPATARDAFATGLRCLAPSEGQAPDRPPSPSHGDRDRCLLCGNCCDGAAPLASAPIHLGMAPVQAGVLASTVTDRALPASRRDPSRQARAPPVLS